MLAGSNDLMLLFIRRSPMRVTQVSRLWTPMFLVLRYRMAARRLHLSAFVYRGRPVVGVAGITFLTSLILLIRWKVFLF